VTGAKICGLSTPETVRAALDGGAAYLGFVFFPRSPRNVAAEVAARLAAPARGRAKIVALMVDPDDRLVDEVAAALKPDLIQLHGRETPARASAIAARAGTGLIKALPIAETSDLAAASGFDGLVDHLMFDAKPSPAADRPGGLGAAFDWSLLAGQRFQRPHFLAGGLDPWNVTEAIAVTRAPLVDVSSGVERGAGLKDAGLIASFLEAVRRA
jgi:phosphoribosylanthranilate isomerase